MARQLTETADPAGFWRNSSGSARAMRYISLVYSLFFVIQPIYEHSWEKWLWFGIVYAAFLALYFVIPHTHGRLQQQLLAQLFALGFIYFPFNQSASGLFVYPIVIFAFMTDSMRTYITVLLLQSAGIVLETAVLHLNWIPASIGIFFCLVVGFSNFAYSRQQRAQFQLNRANDQIEHLAQVAERERIARDLHDLLGHTLTLIAIKSELANRLLPVDAARAAVEMQEVEQTARKALADVREAVTGYRGEGITTEVERARHTLQAAGVQLSVSLEPVALNPLQSNALCLALREGVTNIVRHARAATATLTLAEDGSHFVLRLEDDGVGVSSTEGNGMRGMRERVREHNGAVFLQAGVTCGTTLLVTLPTSTTPSPTHCTTTASSFRPKQDSSTVLRSGETCI